ncbi:hypothetical protein [Pelagibius sp.]|uniref:hypothetical protein n=1 Tax=Pelagibius sp. TaxID=1931238 RepID=UPI003B50F8A9
MNRLLIKIVLIPLGFAGFFFYMQVDRATNYEETMARVTKVEALCYMTKRERGVLSKTTTTTDHGPCASMKRIHETHPAYKDYRLVKVTYVEYRYRSPADGKIHRGKHEQVKHPDGKAVKSGDTLLVLAHKTNAEKTQRF